MAGLSGLLLTQRIANGQLNRGQQLDDLATFLHERFELRTLDNLAVSKQIQPVSTFHRFLVGNADLREEIGACLRRLPLCKVGSDGCTASQNLIGKDKFMHLAQLLAEANDPQSESVGFINDNILFHARTLKQHKKLSTRIFHSSFIIHHPSLPGGLHEQQRIPA